MTPISEVPPVPLLWTGKPGRLALNLARQFPVTHALASWWLRETPPLPSQVLAKRTCPKIIVGPMGAPSGLGQAARLSAAALREAGHHTAVIDLAPYFTGGASDHAGDFESGLRIKGPAQVITFVNGDYVPFALALLGRRFLADKHVTANLAWELPRIPRSWRRALQAAHDFWAPSRFTAHAIRSGLADMDRPEDRGKSVSVHPHPVAVGADAPSSGAPRPGPFTFGFSFSMHAGMMRKNPQGLIETFQDTFGESPAHRLSLHVQAIDAWQDGAAILRRAAEASNIDLLTGTLSRSDYLDWLSGLDAFVSLHRAEGFGLTMAEALLAGLPVIATGGSGAADFLSGPTCFTVPFAEVNVVDPQGVTPQNCGGWAQPDLAVAASHMRDIAQGRPRAVPADLEALRNRFSAAAFLEGPNSPERPGYEKENQDTPNTESEDSHEHSR